MKFTSAIISLLATMLPVAMAATNGVQTSNGCASFHPSDCRQFTLDEFPSDGIENHMVLGNSSNLPKGLMEFEGLFYMNGNGIDDEVSSFANMKLDSATGEFVGAVYDTGLFGFNANQGGRLLYQSIRKFGLHYRVKETSPGTWLVTPQIFTPAFLTLQAAEFEIPQSISKFEIVKTDDPNVYSRVSSFGGKQIPPYRFVRIAHGDGRRTEKYDSEYLPNIDSNKPKVTLSKNQLVARQI